VAQDTKRRLLAIDDEKSLLAILHEAGTRVGYEVETTTSPEYFLTKTREWRPTLIIMDLQMPEVDGVELLRRLAAERVSVPIVLMSGVDDKLLRTVEDLGAELGLSMRGMLTKPIRLQTFRTRPLHPTRRGERIDRRADRLRSADRHRPGRALGGRAFRMTVIAEGIGTEPQLDELVRRHCAMAQGYLLAKPGPPEEVERRFDAVAPRLTDRGRS
jgi:CheY-like chemotaxis protein